MPRIVLWLFKGLTAPPTGPEKWSEAFEIQKKPLRHISGGTSRDVVITVGMHGVTAKQYEMGKDAFHAAALAIVQKIDETALLEV